MFLNRYYHLKRTTRFRRIGIGFLAAGLVFAGTAGAPLLLEVQWQTGQLTERIRGFASRNQQSEGRAVGRLPGNADVVDPMALRVKAFALVGTVHAAAANPPAAPVLASQAKLAAVTVPPAALSAAKHAIDRMKIPGIRVDMQIAGGMSEKVLNRGLAWKLPYTSTPDKGGNTVIGCHRYLYTSGSRTCFNLDKVKEGDEIVVDWQGMRYYYSVREIKVVAPEDVSILNATRTPVLTVFTCTPKFTSKLRLAVIADLIKTDVIY